MDVNSPVAPKPIEATFVRQGELYELQLTGRQNGISQRLEATPEHPLYVAGRGWTPVEEIFPGDRIAVVSLDELELAVSTAGSQSRFGQTSVTTSTSQAGKWFSWQLLSDDESIAPGSDDESDDRWLTVESNESTGRFTTVYNFCVADWHTYFVASDDPEVAIWAHNSYLEAVANGIPSVRGGAFQSWFNKLTPDELQKIWADPALRKQIEQRLRSPGGFHEWLPVSRAPIFKEWGITADQIHQLRTPTQNVVFKSGKHGGDFSGTAHQQLFKLIDESPDFATYVHKLRAWADDNLVGGAKALPQGLRP